MERFEGFGTETVAFFEGLAADNSKTFFEANRASYERAVRAPMAALLAEAANLFAGEVHLFRPNRDIRFSRDKSPYKTECSGLVRAIPGSAAPRYASVSASGFLAATGYHGMAEDQVARYRAAVDDPQTGAALAELLAGLRKAGLEVSGRGVGTAPRGFRRDHPRIDLLRLKEIVVGAPLPPERLASRAPADHAFAVWREAMPLLDWLDDNVGPSAAPIEARLAAAGRRPAR